MFQLKLGWDVVPAIQIAEWTRLILRCLYFLYFMSLRMAYLTREVLEQEEIVLLLAWFQW